MAKGSVERGLDRSGKSRKFKIELRLFISQFPCEEQVRFTRKLINWKSSTEKWVDVCSTIELSAKGICAGSRVIGVSSVIHVYVDSCKGGCFLCAANASANMHQKR